MMNNAALWMLASLLISTSAFAAIDKPGRDEVIEEVARVTELGKDAVSLVFKEDSALLASLDESVFAIKVINKFCEAKDAEALADLQDYALGKALDRMKDKLLPQAMNGLLLAFSAYKTSLEVIRDYYFLPKFDNKIYQAYKEARQDDLRREDSSFESRQTAFSRATTQKSSGYFVIKDQMYEKMIKAKDYNKELIAPPLEKKLRSQIDDFWRDRLELRLQQELLQTRRSEMIAAVWENSRRQVDAVRARAGRAGGPERFFLTQKDLPAGWKLIPRDRSKPEQMIPQKRNDGAYAQTVKMAPTGYLEKNNAYYDATGKKVLSFMHNSISVSVQPTVQTMPSGYVHDFREQVKESIRNKKAVHFQPSIMLRTWAENGAEIGFLALNDQPEFRRADRYIAAFVKGNWYVTVEIDGYSLTDLERLAQDEASRSKERQGSYILKTPASEEMLVYLAKTIADKIR